MPSPEVIVSLAPPRGAPALDHAVSLALLRRVQAGEAARVVRVWRPVPALALGRLDVRSPGAAAAVAAARAAGFPAIRRLSGGHATLLTRGSLSVGVGEPAADLTRTTERYRRLSRAVVDALAAVGVAASDGELPGEWCPGAWSVHAGGVKLAGLAQRAVRGAAWTEAVISVGPGTDEEARVLAGVYEALGLALDPATVGGAADLSAAATHEALAQALLAALGADGAAADGPGDAVLERAAALACEFAA